MRSRRRTRPSGRRPHARAEEARERAEAEMAAAREQLAAARALADEAAEAAQAAAEDAHRRARAMSEQAEATSRAADERAAEADERPWGGDATRRRNSCGRPTRRRPIEDIADKTKPELLDLAASLDIDGRSGMTKDELAQAVRSASTRRRSNAVRRGLTCAPGRRGRSGGARSSPAPARWP